MLCSIQATNLCRVNDSKNHSTYITALVLNWNEVKERKKLSQKGYENK